MTDYNDPLGVQRDPNDRWIDNSDIATEILPQLHRLYGLDHLTADGATGREMKVNLKGFVAGGDPAQVFDVIQLWYDELPPDRQRSFQQELNEVFEEETFPWCFCERSFFQVDSKFLEERVQAQVHELLKTEGHLGAMQEFVEARNDFAASDFKGSSRNSCKAFESVMKTIRGKDGGSADDLIKAWARRASLTPCPRTSAGPSRPRCFRLYRSCETHSQATAKASKWWLSRENSPSYAFTCLARSSSFVFAGTLP